MQPHYNFDAYPPTLLNLGKATRRGIKKCPKCSHLNGTRGTLCKNPHCDAILTCKPLINLDAARLDGTMRRVYSVRVRDHGPDHRGFVQLPLQSGAASALCFVESCRRLFDDSILKCHELEGGERGLCAHIEAAAKSGRVAEPIELRKDVLEVLRADDSIKARLWCLATDKDGPLVQRVSQKVVAVKCQVSSKNPLGYLHFSFGTSKGLRDGFDRFACSCGESGDGAKRAKCLHYYACACALASGVKFAVEFSHFINLEFPQEGVSYAISPKSVELTRTKRKLGKGKAPRASKGQDAKKMVKQVTVPLKITILDGHLVQLKPTWGFSNWLIYATESINQTMRFENYGNLNNLLFYIPEDFYEEFKKRIPQVYKSFQASTSFHIMNIQHLKQIFDTNDVKLKISKRFIHDNQNGYVEYIEREDTATCSSSFIFFLNVGQSTVDESDNTNNSFLIEWYPNCTKISKIGQLKLQYKYGRKCT